jgi:hemolysin activation/secretion protein
MRVNLSTDNLLRTNDFMSLTYQTGVENESTGNKSDTVSFHADQPFGYWLTGFDGSVYQYKNRISSEDQTFESSGESNSQSISISRVLYRGRTGKTEWLNTLSRKESTNYIEGVKLDTSSRTLAVGKIQLRHRELLPSNQVIQGSISYKQGLDLFGSPKKSEVENAPEPLYNALVGDLSYQTSAKLLKRKVSLQSALNWQYSEDVLFGSEQFGVGGLYSVRGFKGESISGRTGVVLRNEVSTGFALPENFLKLHSITPTLSWDIGTIFDEPEQPNNEEALQGIALGIRIGGQHVSFDSTFSHALVRPNSFSNELNQIHLALTIKR